MLLLCSYVKKFDFPRADHSPDEMEFHVNGRSLSGMSLTRERWCCAGCWLNRLDMNTCQTSIKTDMLL